MSAPTLTVKVTVAWWLRPVLLGCLALTWLGVTCRVTSEEAAAEWLESVLERNVSRAMKLTVAGTN